MKLNIFLIGRNNMDSGLKEIEKLGSIPQTDIDNATIVDINSVLGNQITKKNSMLESTTTLTNIKPPFCRIHLFEFEDLNIPQVFRNLLTDILGHFVKSGLYDGIVPVIYKVLQEQQCDTIVDLCTGSGEPAILLKEKILQDYQLETQLILTDKFPNISKATNIINKRERATYLSESIDATVLPKNLKGLRTLFASLHHFKADQVKGIFQDAVNNDQPIAVFEFTERTWIRAFLMVPAILHMLIITPFIKPFSLTRIFWTYVIPVMPIIYFWDGLVSNLRTYTIDELHSIINTLDDNHFTWKINTVPTSTRQINVTYVIGRPRLSQSIIAEPQQKIKEKHQPTLNVVL